MSGALRLRLGRVELAWLLAALFACALLAVVYLGWWPARVRLAVEEARRLNAAPAAPDPYSLAAVIEKLDQRLARIETALAMQDSSGAREALEPAEGAPRRAESLSSDLELKLERISEAVDQLAIAIQENRKPAFSMPALAQIHAARRDVDWAFVDSVRVECDADYAQALERVRLMTFEELLRKVGVPSSIRVTDDGAWIYQHEVLEPDGSSSRGIILFFVGDSGSGVTRF